MQTLHKNLLRILCLLALLTSGLVNAQIAYSIGFFGTSTLAADRTAVFVINPSTGVASTPTVPNAILYPSSAMAVSPLNGFVYYIERSNTATTPRFGTWNPLTGTAANIGPTGTTGINILRATFCPNGRFYIGPGGADNTTGPQIFELNPTTGAVIRTITLTGAQAGGSGDVVCTNNGDLYLLSATVGGAGGTYTLYKVTSAQLSGAAATGTAAITPTAQGSSLPNAPNGIFETPNTLAGCAAPPEPCLMVSGGGFGLMYTFNSTNGAFNTLTTASLANLTDMSREFPRDLSISKTVTPTAALQSGNLVTYTLVVRNPGPAVAGNVSVIDSLPSTGVVAASATWSCSIPTVGQTTNAISSACANATGTGPLNTTVNLAIGGTAQFIISVPLVGSFTGTLTNTATAALPGAAFDSDTSNNIVTTTSAVNPATSLGVTKTDGTLTVVAGTTNSYTVTFTNSGTGNGAGSVIKDVPSAGLSNCSVATCIGTGTPLAVCPLPLNNLLTVAGATVTTFPANSSLVYTVSCGVTATGQ